MTLTSIIAALGGLSAIVGGVVYIFKYTTWLVTKTPSQTQSTQSATEQAAQQQSEQDGIPR